MTHSRRILPLLLLAICTGLPLSVGGAQGIELRPNSVVEGLGSQWPIYCGVPFPRGTLNDPQAVRLVDDAGRPVPARTRAMARWADDGSVRWLGVDFLGDPVRRYTLRFGDAIQGPDTAEGPSVTMLKAGDGYVVTTGPAKFTVPFRGPLVSRAWLDHDGNGRFSDDELVIRNDAGDDIYVVDNSNRTATIGRDREAGQVRAEPDDPAAGGSPLHACLRREGWYVTEHGKRVARHITRLHFYAGRSFVRLEHTFVFTEDSDSLWFRDVGIRFRHGLDNARRITFDSSPAFDTECTIVDLGDSDASAFLLQEKVVQFSQRDLERDQRFVIGRVGRDGKVQEVRSGQRCGEWASVAGAQAGLAVAVRDFWQQFPKEIEATRNALTVHLWSDRGGQELDVRLKTLRKKWPTEWLSMENADYKAMVKRPPNALGAAKTHELLLCLQAPRTALQETVRLAHVLNRPVVCIVDPAQLYRSEAMGPIHPQDEKRFPLAEGFMETWFDQYMAIVRRWHDYGYFDYGSGPHVWYRVAPKGPLKGRWMAYTTRYSGQIDYGFHTHLWRMYARSGQRKYLEVAEEMNRHRMDVCMVHWDSPKAYKPIIGSYMHGKYKGAFTAGNSPDYWSPYSTLHHQSGTDLRKLYWYYYLLDYRRAHDVAEEYRALVLKVWHHKKGPFIGTRPFATLKCLATLYQETGDPEVLAIGRERLEALVDLKSPQGVTPHLATKFGKYGPKIAAVERWFEATGDKLAADALIRGATTLARTSIGARPYSYYNCMARVLNRAYRLTEDPLYATAIERNMRLAIAMFHDPETGCWSDFFSDVVSAADNVYPMGDMAIGMDAIVRCGESLSPTPFVQQTGRGRPVLACFLKPAGTEAMVDVRGRFAVQPRVYTSSGIDVKAVQLEPFGETINSLAIASPSRAVVVRVPAALPAGTYVLDAGVGAAPWEITRSSVVPTVLYAPGGLITGCGGTWKGRFYPGATPEAAPSTWFFHVPEGMVAFRIFRSGGIMLRDADGRPVPCEPEAPGWADVPVAADQAGRMWSFRAQKATFVELRGVPPFLAADRPERFFEPDLAGLDVGRLGLERDYSFTDEPAFSRDTMWASPERGVALADGRALALDRGVTLGDGRYENFNANEGTLEVWLKPDWSGVYEPRSRAAERRLLDAGPWSITLGCSGHPNSVFSVHGTNGTLLDVTGLSTERGRWIHLAYQWYRDGEDFVMETYVDGRLRNLGHHLAPGKGPYVGRRAGWQPREVGKRLVFGRGGATHRFLDALAADLHLSDVRRYHADFLPRRSTQSVPDGHTLALFRFDGTTEGITAGDRTVSMKLLE